MVKAIDNCQLNSNDKHIYLQNKKDVTRGRGPCTENFWKPPKNLAWYDPLSCFTTALIILEVAGLFEN